MTTIPRILKLTLLCLLISGRTGFAASISPAQPGANTTYNLTSGPVACGAGVCTTTLLPPGVVNLGQAGSSNMASPLTTDITGLETALTKQFPGFSYAFGGSLSSVTFNINTYSAFNNGTNGGATLSLNMTNSSSNLPTNLHWVQWVTDNANITGLNGTNLAAPKGLGNPENVIDGSYPVPGYGQPMQGSTFPGSPFYDVFPNEDPNAFDTAPPIFSDMPQRGEPTPANPVITWNAYLFLVSASSTTGNTTTPVPITFYDGIEWGWQTVLTPLPQAWILFLGGLGLGGMLLKRRAASSPSSAV